MNKAVELREKYPTFTYSSYSWELTSNNQLVLTFNYHISTNNIDSDNSEIIYFSPQVTINNVTQKMINKLGSNIIDSYSFHIGLSEMLSYWKTSASPQIVIKAGQLSIEETSFWHKLFINGMGEYFYQNQIDFSKTNFLNISSDSEKKHSTTSTNDLPSSTRILVPVGGGKDSSVTLEILKKHFDVGTYDVSAPKAAQNIIKTAQIPEENQIKIYRKLDEKMLALNKQGYLNGHVPISAFLAFLSVFVADLFDYTHVAISNERSSNEGNTWYFDREINHQYSKTYEFERDFQNYVKSFLPENTPFYFSFLRPLYELQIGQLFATMPQYQSIFRSCNKGQKENIWCGNCSKCLFAWTILFPFIREEKITEYFGKNLFTDENLWSVTMELLGIGKIKPFECVGTREETIVAFYLAIQKYHHLDQPLPILLQKVENELKNNQHLQNGPDGEIDLNSRASKLLNSWNSQNSLQKNFEDILQDALSDSANKLKNG